MGVETVGELIEALSTLPPDTPLRLRANPPAATRSVREVAEDYLVRKGKYPGDPICVIVGY